MILSTFPFLFIELISNEVAFSNYILIYLSNAAALTVEAVREKYRAKAAADRAEAAAALVAGIDILQNGIIRD